MRPLGTGGVHKFLRPIAGALVLFGGFAVLFSQQAARGDVLWVFFGLSCIYVGFMFLLEPARHDPAFIADMNREETRVDSFFELMRERQASKRIADKIHKEKHD